MTKGFPLDFADKSNIFSYLEISKYALSGIRCLQFFKFFATFFVQFKLIEILEIEICQLLIKHHTSCRIDYLSLFYDNLAWISINLLISIAFSLLFPKSRGKCAICSCERAYFSFVKTKAYSSCCGLHRVWTKNKVLYMQ